MSNVVSFQKDTLNIQRTSRDISISTVITTATIILLFALRIPLAAKAGLIIIVALVIWSFIDLIRGTDRLVYNADTKTLKIYRSHLGQHFKFEGPNDDFLRLQLEEETHEDKTKYAVYIVFYNKKARLIYELGSYGSDKSAALNALNDWRQKLKIDDDVIDVDLNS